MRGIVGALVAIVVAMAVAGPGTAAAKERVLVLGTAAGALEPGAQLTFSSANFQFEDSGGARLSCAQATLEGTLTGNGAPQINAVFTSSQLMSEPHPGCFAEPPEVFIEYVPLNAVGLPWTATFSRNGTIKIAGAHGVGFEIAATSPGCTWYGKRLLGTFITPLGFMSTAAPNQRLSLEREAPCWSKGPVNANRATIAAEWTLTSDGEEVVPLEH